MEPPYSDIEEEGTDGEPETLEPAAYEPRQYNKSKFVFMQKFSNLDEAEKMIRSEDSWRRTSAPYKSKNIVSTRYDCNKLKKGIKFRCKARLKLVKTLNTGEFLLFSSGYHNHDEIDEKYLRTRNRKLQGPN